MSQILTLNPIAAAILEGKTRLRVNKKTRAGVWYTAIRPSDRVAGRNAMIRVEAVEGSTSLTTEFDHAAHAAIVDGLPELKNNHTYVLFDIGYGWFMLKEPEDATDQTKPLITVTKGKKAKAAAPAADTSAEPAAGAETGEVKADTSAEVAPDTKPAEIVADKAPETPAETKSTETGAAAETPADASAPAAVVATIVDTAPSADAVAAAAASVVDKPGDSIEALVAANLAAAEGGDAAPAGEAKTDAPAASGNSAKAKGASRKGAAKKAADPAETKSVKDKDGIITHVIGD